MQLMPIHMDLIIPAFVRDLPWILQSLEHLQTVEATSSGAECKYASVSGC